MSTTNPFLLNAMPWQCACPTVDVSGFGPPVPDFLLERRTHDGSLNRCTDCGTTAPHWRPVTEEVRP